MDFENPSLPQIGSVIPGRNEVSCMSYHEKGTKLFAASQGDNHLRIIDCIEGKASQPTLRCEREQIRVVEATHHEDCVLFAGPGGSSSNQPQRNAISYWSLHDNKILRKFRGHADTVTSISLCPASDTFLTASRDRSVRLWTAGQAGCVSQLPAPNDSSGGGGDTMVAYDSTGLVFAIAAPSSDRLQQHVHLYDARNYSGGAFAELTVLQTDIVVALEQHGLPTDRATAAWKSMQFNRAGDRILVAAERGLAIVLDGFEGTIQRVMVEEGDATAACCFTSDDKTVLQGGNPDGSISCWNIEMGTVQKKLMGHIGPVRCISSNPMYTQIASSCTQTALWTW